MSVSWISKEGISKNPLLPKKVPKMKCLLIQLYRRLCRHSHDWRCSLCRTAKHQAVHIETREVHVARDTRLIRLIHLIRQLWPQHSSLSLRFIDPVRTYELDKTDAGREARREDTQRWRRRPRSVSATGPRPFHHNKKSRCHWRANTTEAESLVNESPQQSLSTQPKSASFYFPIYIKKNVMLSIRPGRDLKGK